jgi:predicted Rossmann fold nucleotide-binding protein DprA/Smf involved in DNA uptake
MQKEIFVAPNQLFSPNGKGSNQLIGTKQVHVLSDFQQILEKFSPAKKEKNLTTVAVSLSPEEESVMKIVHLNAHKELSQRSESVDLDYGSLLSQLTLLEMK